MQKAPFASRIGLGVSVFFVALVLTGMIEGLVPIKKYFPFTGMAILLLVTWLLYKVDNKNLSELGLQFTYNNYKFLFYGVILSICAFLSATVLKNLITGQVIEYNENYSVGLIFLGLYYLIPNVVVEELLYRGYLFKKTIDKTSFFMTNIIFSIIFMLVHVLDSQVLSSLGGIILMAVTIPIGHLLFAVALVKSKTILFPIGLHLDQEHLKHGQALLLF
ncbi:MAG: lysostaphin resistance A-like protein [Marinicellaceae bacterium]